jgi:hypothetical protein
MPSVTEKIIKLDSSRTAKNMPGVRKAVIVRSKMEELKIIKP